MKEREAKLYQNLPQVVKDQLGHEFTYEDMKRFMEQNEIPDFYKDAPVPQPLPYRRDEPELEQGEQQTEVEHGDNQGDDNQDKDSPETNEETEPETNEETEPMVSPVGQDEEEEVEQKTPRKDNSVTKPDTLDKINETDTVQRMQLRTNPKKKVIFDL